MRIRIDGVRLFAALAIAGSTASLFWPNTAEAAGVAARGHAQCEETTSVVGCFTPTDSVNYFALHSYCIGAGCQTCVYNPEKECGFQSSYDRSQ